MFDSEHEERLFDDFLRLAADHPYSKAVYYIRELWEQKGEPISATRLYTLFQSNFHVYLDDDLKHAQQVMRCLHLTEYPELPFPCLDRHALDEIGAFVSSLRRDLALAQENNDLARIDEDIARLEEINSCLAGCFSRKGKVRYLGNLTRDHTRLIWQSVKHLLDCVHPVHPELAEHIDAHIIISADCYWSLNPHRSRG